jgi:SAM-dependent methyltransferase
VGADIRPGPLTAPLPVHRRLRALVRDRLPLAVACLRFARTLPLRWRGAESVFSGIHRQNCWLGEESMSGPGSSLAATAALRRELPRLLAQLGCASLLDAPCGDLWWLKEAALPVASYCGVDIVPAVIAQNRRRHAAPGRTFLCLDVRRDPLPQADLVLCRDCLVHLSFRDALAALANFRASGAAWLLTTTFTGQHAHRDVLTGEWRPLNLQLPPFSLPPPLALLDERCPEEDGRYRDKSLGLWRTADLPAGR